MTKFKHQVLITTDQSFCNRLPALIRNLLAFATEHVDFYIITSFPIENSPEKELFNDLLTSDRLTLHFHYISPEHRFKYEQVDYSKDARGNAMSLRLYATELNITGRLLYLDADIICAAPYAELFDSEQVDLQGKTLGVVADSYIMNKANINGKVTYTKKLSTPAAHLDYNAQNVYFNSGFLLIDMDKLNTSNLWLKHIAELKNYTAFPDQDLLNVIHYGDTVELSSKYNYLIYHLINTRYYFFKDGWPEVFAQKLKETRKSPDVFAKVTPTFLHFAGRQKQWNNSALEFVNAYELFNQPLEKVLAKPVSYYQDYFKVLYKVYGYTQVLNDYTPLTAESTNNPKLKASILAKDKRWTFNPLYLNTKMFAYRGVKTLIRNALTTKGREALNRKLYQQVNAKFQQELSKLNAKYQE